MESKGNIQQNHGNRYPSDYSPNAGRWSSTQAAKFRYDIPNRFKFLLRGFEASSTNVQL